MPETPTPGPEVKALTEGRQKEQESKKIDDADAKRLAEIGGRLRAFIEDPNPETRLARRKALYAAIQSVSTESCSPRWITMQIFNNDAEQADWFLADFNSTPQNAENVLKNMTSIDDAWRKILLLPQRERAARLEASGIYKSLSDLSENLRRCSESQVQELMTDDRLFRRLFDLYRDMYSRGADGRGAMDVVRVLSARVPAVAASEAIACNFITESTNIVGSVLDRRALFFAMARHGPPGRHDVQHERGRTYMNWVWYDRMSNGLQNDIGNLPVDERKALNLPLNERGNLTNEAIDRPRDAGRRLMHLYNGGGFDIVRTMAALGSLVRDPRIGKQLRESGALQIMFRLATHPSPVNGHVTLSVVTLACLADIAEANPSLFDSFIDVRDPPLRQTPREFFAANAVRNINDRIPFDDLTDSKMSGSYSNACARLHAVFPQPR